LIAICMATFNPRADLLRAQLDSIRGQTGVDWTCFISDDASDDQHYEELEAQVGGDRRFVLSRSPDRLGFYRNFERALTMIDGDFDFVALSDQDDRWNPDKLTRLLDGLGGAQLVYSDQRVVASDGRIISPTYWTNRRNNYTNLISLLIANTVTGAASLFRRDLLEFALPFPAVPGEQYHDHWLALVALSVGDLAYIDEPLYDYVQHGNAVLGHDVANVGSRGRPILQRLDPRRLAETVNGWASAYFEVYLRLQALAQALLARCGGRMSRPKEMALRRFVATNRDPLGPLRLWLRSLRSLAGRNETLGVERILARALLYRHLAAAKNRFPDAMIERVSGGSAAAAPSGVIEADRMTNKIRPLTASVEATAPERVNILIPAIDLEHFFGGYIAKFNLARKLAEAGRRVRIITVDPNRSLDKQWQSKVEGYAGLAGIFESVEIEFGRDGTSLIEFSPSDRFVATTWWTAHIADELVAQTGGDRFLYLIQEFEPLTVPPGSWAALAQDSYRLPHHGLFSTGILRDYFRKQGYGVYDPAAGDADSATFQNAITAVEPPSAGAISQRGERKLLFYARPEAHAARNMFELGLMAIRGAVAEGLFDSTWSLGGVGSLGGPESIPLSRGHSLDLTPRRSQSGYGEQLAGNDIGLALMYAPHPSLVPIEMASAGMLTVTNTFETKTSAAMAAISSNINAVAPNVGSLVEALRHAVSLSADGNARVAGAAVDWSRDWDETFNGETLNQVLDLLDRC
jgi:glycosyltransferase involved in cell wall biosynthesis